MSYDISFQVRVHGTDLYVPVGTAQMLHGTFGILS